MSNVGSVLNFFSTANEGFTTTLGSTISSGATTVLLAGTSGLTDGSVFVGIIEPGLTNQQVFTGTVSVGTTSIINVVWTRGANVAHAAGVTIVDYVTGTDFNMLTTGILKDHVQSGGHGPLHDANNSLWIDQGATASAVNRVMVANAATGNGPTISAVGSDTNIPINLVPKGTGLVNLPNSQVTKLLQTRTTNASTGASFTEVVYNGFTGTYTWNAVIGRTYAITLNEPTITTTGGSGSFDFFVNVYVNSVQNGRFILSSLNTGVTFYINQTIFWLAGSTGTASLNLKFTCDGTVTGYQMGATSNIPAQLVVRECP